ncbi:MAG TPA: DUF3644 domain-containing protein [Ktedonobacteraceae bacterium]|nr:DUF3644 domain-containing protein [Ktedonobacteraceae bacterium]
MVQIYDEISTKALCAALSSIEIYNKPDFKYREEMFTILIVNAWELLLKAKRLKDENDNIACLYATDNKGITKTSRNGTPMTKDIIRIMNEVNLDTAVSENLRLLIEIRDSVVHYYRDDSLSYLLYTLGVAALKNFQKLMTAWFCKSFLDYNFYILPLGFAYNFKTLSILELEKAPEPISNLIKYAASTQSSIDASSDFQFVCEISVQMKSAKQLVSGADITAAIDANAADAVFIDRVVPLIDRYPISYTDLKKKVQKERPNAKQSVLDKVIREHNIKNNPNMSAYNFRNKTQEENYKRTKVLPSGTPSLYDDNAFRFIIEHIEGN